jgi:tetratricopeptide (TPR) repeat protein
MRTLFSAACGLALFVCVAHAAYSEEKWHEASSANFVLVTNASPERAESILLTLERFRAALAKVLPELRRGSSIPTRLYGFRDHDSLEPFVPPSETRQSRVTGYFRKGASENVIVLDLTFGTPAFERVLFHEYLHLVLSWSERDFPLWFEEGLSEFYAGSRIDEGGAEVGVSDPRHRALLSRVPLMPIEELLSIGEAGESEALFYAQSWALVHYLLIEAPEGRERLARFLSLHEGGAEPVAAFRDAFGSEPTAMQAALAEYLKRPRWSGVKVDLSPASLEPALSRRLSKAEVQQRWGALFLATSRLREARVCLEEAVRLDPELGSGWEGLGFLELEEGDRERAMAHLEKAVDLEGASASGLYRYADILLADYRGRVDSIPDAVAEKAASALKRGLALEPAAQESVELLAFLYVVRGERLDEAEALVGSALQIEPDDPPLLFLRGQLLAKRGEYEEARKTLKRALETSEDPRLRAEAEEFLARMTTVERAPGR